MADKTLHEKLSDPKISFLQKLRLASSYGLDYWWARGNPPNESPDVYRQILKLMKEPSDVKWIERDSQAGENALLGESECFKFEVEVVILGKMKRYFCKGILL